MIKNIDINKRLLRSLYDFCLENNLNFNEYIEETLFNKLNIDKYGDLNLLKKNKQNIHIDNLFLDIEKKCISLRIFNDFTKDVNDAVIELEQFDNFKEAIDIWADNCKRNDFADKKEDKIIENKKNNTKKRILKIN